MHYSDNLRKKLYTELMANEKFVKFAKKEHEERASIKGVFCFEKEFEKDVFCNLESYKDQWETHCFFSTLDWEDEETQEIMNNTLEDVLKDFQ